MLDARHAHRRVAGARPSGTAAVGHGPLLFSEVRTLDGTHKKPRGVRDVRVDRTAHPDWVTALDRLPARGEHVHTNEGGATVVAILGKTQVGGRLLELSMDDGRKHP